MNPRHSISFFVAAILFLGILSACSHKTPYMRADAGHIPEISVDNADIRQRILLIGDAGIPKEREPVLELMEAWASEMPEKTFSVFLGDNIYPNGVPDKNDPFRAEAERRMNAQIAVLANSDSKGIFVPGNHDWAGSKSGGLQILKNQQDLVIDALGPGSFEPMDGCPGPVSIDLNTARIIALDTQWWLTSGERPEAGCPSPDEDAVLKELDRLLATADNRNVIVVVHHPWATHGSHGGFFTWKDHIFPLTNAADWLYLPLPIIGSLYPLITWNVLNRDQDLNGSKNKEMRRRMGEVFSKYQPLIIAAGHEHSLQLMEGKNGPQYAVVSGSGSEKKVSPVGHGEDTLFAHEHTGFMAVDILNNGAVLLRIVEPAAESVVFAKWLKQKSLGG